MLDLEESQQVSPASLAAELATARRIETSLMEQTDRTKILAYIAELERELAAFLVPCR